MQKIKSLRKDKLVTTSLIVSVIVALNALGVIDVTFEEAVAFATRLVLL